MLYSGNTYKHTADFPKHLNLQFVSSTHDYKTQKKNNSISSCGTNMDKKPICNIEANEQSSSVYVCGDGRCDTPGLLAKYGTYTLMDEKTNLIIEFSCCSGDRGNIIKYNGV